MLLSDLIPSPLLFHPCTATSTHARTQIRILQQLDRSGRYITDRLPSVPVPRAPQPPAADHECGPCPVFSRADLRRATADGAGHDRPRERRALRPGTVLWHHVVDYLKAGYSPEQVAGTLATVQSGAPSLQVFHESIYTAIYAMPRGALRTEVIGWLRLGHAKRRPRALI